MVALTHIFILLENRGLNSMFKIIFEGGTVKYLTGHLFEHYNL